MTDTFPDRTRCATSRLKFSPVFFGRFLALRLCLPFQFCPPGSYISHDKQLSPNPGGDCRGAVSFLPVLSNRPTCYLLYAAGALGIWAASNIAWYFNIVLGQRSDVYPGLIDMGIIASILILGVE